MKRFVCLLRRELWEHSSAYWVPVIVGALMLASALVALVLTHNLNWDSLGGQAIVMQFELDADAPSEPAPAQHAGNLETLLEGFAGLDATERAALIHRAILDGANVFQLATLIWMLVYALEALHGERKDRSILFWQSLPVSDTQTVLSKAATAVILAPLFAFAALVITQCLLLGLASTVLWAFDHSPGELLWRPAHPFALWGRLLAAYLAWALWLSPIIAWILLVSAWARRLPSLYAVLIPAVLVILENLMLGSNTLGAILSNRLTGFDIDRIGAGLDHSVAIDAGSGVFALLGLPALWAGVATAGVLIVAAALGRRYRDAYGVA